MKDALGQLAAPLRALVVAFGGILFAWWWLRGDTLLAVSVVAAVLAVGLFADWIGRTWLPRYPQPAVRALEWWVLVPGALAAAAAGLVVVVTVELASPDGTDPQTKQLVGALSTGITSFLSTGFVAWAGDEKDSRLADRIKKAFFAAYKRSGDSAAGRVHYFRPDSDGERWIYSEDFRGVSGWGRPDRIVRAKSIAQELQSGASNP